MKKSEIKKLISEILLESINEDVILDNMANDAEYHKGYRAGVKARVYGPGISDEDLTNYSRSFRKGYKRALYGSWWDRFNTKLTDLGGRLGYSRTRGF